MEYQLTLNWPDFLERHWQKRPVVLKRGFTNFIDPLSPDEPGGAGDGKRNRQPSR
ncbi:cupin family protein [Salmonella enterica subsp. enterica serovar Typhi]|nr:cupin family protein [Salmonella enterica subsp. enterica serovar Typhi]CGJ62729.1 cupin family protein [Salmonella enterica subsp. enterica serovar Typhi]CGZ82243.1 cupin family protein [Salmonella enterica subsp. enterica serovar Typhi]CIO04990.1 cupin family protein [Salmonella enterica subsp. enterica serovar Typhi]